MSMRKPAVFGLLALFASLAPAFAGTVYVPVAPQQRVGDVSYRTQIVVSNPGGVTRQLTATFIQSGHDGIRTDGAKGSVNVPAHGTSLLTNFAPAGREGMLEITGSELLAVSARLEAVSASGRVLSSTPLPVIDSNALIPAGITAHLQGIGRNATGYRHRFGLVNLGTQAAACTMTAWRADGSPVGNPARLTAQPRSHAAVAGPFAALGAAFYRDARLEMTCDQPFFVYALQLGPQGAGLVSTPSRTLQSELASVEELARARDGDGGDLGGGGRQGGGDDEETGGEDDGGGTDNDGGSTVATQDNVTHKGVFLNARQGDSYKAFELPLRPGVRYKKVTVDFDLYVNKWSTPLFHSIASLRRNDRTLYYGLLMRSDRRKTIIDLGRERTATGVGPWAQRGNYHIRMTANAQARSVTMEMFQSGKLVHTVSGPMTNWDLSVSAKTRMRVDFGATKVADGAYFPPFGWKYSNLAVKAETY
jgi:hypothetical protein